MISKRGLLNVNIQQYVKKAKILILGGHLMTLEKMVKVKLYVVIGTYMLYSVYVKTELKI